MIEELRPLLKKFIVFAKDNLSFKRPPRLFLKQDTANQKCMLGKTAHYDPQKMAITLYVSGRHPKDILRSFSHELVHHCQNERGDLAPEKMKTMNKNYAQENEHMRTMEKEAYLMGNMCFRDWEDGLDDKLQYKMQIAEQKFLKENKNMSVKLKRKDLKGLIEKLLKKRSLNEQLDKQAAPNPISDRGQAASGRTSARNPRVPARIPEEPEPPKRKLAEDPIATAFHKELLAACDDKDVGPGGVKHCNKAKEWKRKWEKRIERTEVPEEDAKRIAEKLKQQGKIDDSKLANLGYTLEEGRLDEKGCAAHVRDDDDAKPAAACDNGGNCPPEAGCETCDAARAESVYEDKTGSGDKIQTPEQEKALYESRFTNRNTRLFEKLLKEWTK